MIQVYFSHVAETSLIGLDKPESTRSGTLRDILAELETRHPGLRQEILDTSEDHLTSAVLVFKHIELDVDGRFLESDFTKPMRGLDDIVSDEDINLLIALFHPERLISFLLKTLTATEEGFEYAGGNKKYRAYISGPDDAQGGQHLVVEAEPEPLYPFTSGHYISELEATDLIDVSRKKLIP